MKSLMLAAVAAAAIASASPSLAATQVLTFSGAVCGPVGGQACGSGVQLGANYGDTVEIDVSYRSIDGATGLVDDPYLRVWNTGFGDLQGVAYADGGGGHYSEIVFKPAAGYEVSLLGFDIATYQRRVASVPISITSFSGAPIQSLTLATNAPTHNSLAVDSDYFRGGIVLRVGPNGYDVALDNIRFDVRPTTVPEPAAWGLMLAGFAGVGATLRRRSAQPLRFT